MLDKLAQMKCPNCGSSILVKNGKSRHGRQRWKCRSCGKTFGEYDRRKIDPHIREIALKQYLAGKGLRATERIVGVSHNAVMEWVFASARKILTQRALPDVLEWLSPQQVQNVKERKVANASGIIIALPYRFSGGKWAVLTPKSPAKWMRMFINDLLKGT